MEVGRTATQVAAALEKYAYDYRQNLHSDHFLRARKIVIDSFLSRVKPGSRILDINCGTGIDTAEMAQRGHTVHGIDISSAMISFARDTIRESRVEGRASVEVADYRDYRAPGIMFDAVISNFGGINFTDDLRPIFENISSFLSQGGIVLVNSVTHFSLMETLIFLSKGNFRKAFRRSTGGAARIGGEWVRLFYHKRSEFVETSARFGFQLVDSFGLNILAPPLWADDFFSRHHNAAAFLEKMDHLIRRMPGARSAGDFMVLVFRKK